MIFASFVKNKYRKLLIRRYDGNPAVFYFDASDFPGLDKEPFSFTSRAGNVLKGYFYTYPENNGKLVIFDHGLGGGHRSYMREIELLCRRGYRVFSYDHTGCMESQGKDIGGLSQSVSDLNDCINALSAAGKISGKLCVMGHSWGAYAALNIPALQQDVCKIVAISGFVSVRSILDQQLKGFLSLYKKDVFSLEKAANPDFCELDAVKSLNGSNARALIIHSDDDPMVDYGLNSKRLEDKLKGSSQIGFITVQGKKHNPNYSSDAVKLLENFSAAFAEASHKGRLNDVDSQKQFKDSFDWRAMTEQDEELWARIFDFLDHD